MECGELGQSGMPDTIRTSGGGHWPDPRRSGFRIAAAGFSSILPAVAGTAAKAQPQQGPAPSSNPSLVEVFVNAFALLERHEIISLAITLSILCFAVVAAILLVRTRARLANTEASARD